VYDITEYVRDHPGGADVLIDVAGIDATAAYEDVGHSKDANDILESYLVGNVKDAIGFTRPKAVRLIPQEPQTTQNTRKPLSAIGTALAPGSLRGALLYYLYTRSRVDGEALAKVSRVLSNWGSTTSLSHGGVLNGGFSKGFVAATLLCATISGFVGTKLSKMVGIDSGFTKYPPHMKSRLIKQPNPHLLKGYLEPKEYKALPLVKKDQLAPNVYRFVFQLPRPQDIVGLPIGQHVAIKATVDGQAVSRSYTPTSNNLDLGKIELLIKCYPDGLLTGKYLANLKVGDQVQFRGPKGAMNYHNSLCKKIGMIAGGTGITPMYQLIRAICEDDVDTTEVSLIYANRTEEDILLRQELEAFACDYPKNFKLWYMLDHPPKDWAYGKGYVTPAVMSAKLPGSSPDTKVMLCGPPGMVNASKKSLIEMGFQAPGPISKMTDQIFCF
jgi:cytochrome-b5 reductase